MHRGPDDTVTLLSFFRGIARRGSRLNIHYSPSVKWYIIHGVIVWPRFDFLHLHRFKKNCHGTRSDYATDTYETTLPARMMYLQNVAGRSCKICQKNLLGVLKR